MRLQLREGPGGMVETRTRPEVRHPRSRAVVVGLMLVQGAAFVPLVGLSGSLPWALVRVASVVALTSLGVVAVRRAGRVGAGVAALLLGIAGTVAGLGIGGVYAAKVGLSATTVAGLLASVTGMALLFWGSASLIRAVPGWWRLTAVPVGLAVVLFLLLPLTMAVNATNRPATPLGDRTLADLGLPYRDVTFVTSDGVRLSAWYVPSRDGAAVVLLHGSGSVRTDVLDRGAVLARHGFGVLLLDTRGHGLSEGRAMDFGWHGELDVAAALSFLEEQADARDGRIGVVGMSMGGEQAIAAAGSDPRIRAVVAEGVTGMQAVDHGWLDRYGARAVVQRGIDWVMYGAAGLLSGAPRPMSLRDAIGAAAPRPVLLVVGGEVPDELYAARYFREASPGSVDLWLVPGSGHTRGLATRPAEWEARVTGFLEEALRP